MCAIFYNKWNTKRCILYLQIKKLCMQRERKAEVKTACMHTHTPLRGGRRKETVIYDFRKQKDFPESTSEESVLLGKKIIRQ